MDDVAILVTTLRAACRGPPYWATATIVDRNTIYICEWLILIKHYHHHSRRVLLNIYSNKQTLMHKIPSRSHREIKWSHIHCICSRFARLSIAQTSRRVQCYEFVLLYMLMLGNCCLFTCVQWTNKYFPSSWPIIFGLCGTLGKQLILTPSSRRTHIHIHVNRNSTKP